MERAGKARERKIPIHLEAHKDGKVRGETAHVAEGETSKGNVDKNREKVSLITVIPCFHPFL